MPGLDGPEHAASSDMSQRDLARRAFGEQSTRPCASWAARQQRQTLAARRDELVAASAVEVHDEEVVEDVARVVDRLGRPVLPARNRRREREHARANAVPGWRCSAATVQRRDDEAGARRRSSPSGCDAASARRQAAASVHGPVPPASLRVARNSSPPEAVLRGFHPAPSAISTRPSPSTSWAAMVTWSRGTAPSTMTCRCQVGFSNHASCDGLMATMSSRPSALTSATRTA